MNKLKSQKCDNEKGESNKKKDSTQADKTQKENALPGKNLKSGASASATTPLSGAYCRKISFSDRGQNYCLSKCISPEDRLCFIFHNGGGYPYEDSNNNFCMAVAFTVAVPSILMECYYPSFAPT